MSDNQRETSEPDGSGRRERDGRSGPAADTDDASPSLPSSRPAATGGHKRRRAVRRWLKRGILAVLAVVVLGGLVWAFLPKPVPVDLAQAARGPMRVSVREDGKTRINNRYVLSAPLTGNMLRIRVRPGDPVDAGATLVRIVPTAPPLLDARTRAETEARLNTALASQRQARAQLGLARTALEQATTNAERQRSLRAQGVVPESVAEQAEFARRSAAEELASAEFAVKVANHQVDQSRATLGRLGKPAQRDAQIDLVSPVSGVVLRVLQESEAVVAAGAPLLEVGDPGALEIVADVLTRDAVHIEPGSRVTIDRWGGDAPLQGHVRHIEPSAFTRVSALGVEEQRVNVIIDFDGAREGWRQLGDGYRVEAQIALWEADDVLAVPASSVFRHGDQWAVYVVRDGAAHLTPIEIGHRNEAKVEVTSGLTAGARVVLHPSDRVTDGVSVVEREA